MLERLIAALLPRSHQSLRLSISLPDLEQQLCDRKALIDTCTSDGTPPHELVQALLAETQATQQ
eukprot:796714-Pleurochrysis_carterae.AAC.1